MKKIFEDNRQSDIQNTNKKVNLREWISIQKVNLSLEDLNIVLNEIQDEIHVRTTNIREMIPNDVWVTILRSVLSIQDLSSIISLKLVCKNWKNIFFNFPLTVAKIYNRSSLKWIPFFPHIQYISFTTECNIPIEYFEKYLTNLTALSLKIGTTICYESVKDIGNEEENISEDFLKSKIEFIFGRMKNLKKLSFPIIEYGDPILDDFYFGSPFKTFPLMSIECLKSFKSIEKLKLGYLPKISLLQASELLKLFINLKQLVIKRLPLILFGNQRNHLQLILDDFSRLEYVKLYLVDYINCHRIQKRFPKVRFCWFIDLEGDEEDLERAIGKYEGNFSYQNNNREGRGVYFIDGTRYEGEWKNDKREGKGEMIYYNGDKYEGEWKNDEMNGIGVYIWADGDKYEGEYVDSEREGRGTMYYSDGSQYEGEWSGGNKLDKEWNNEDLLNY